jgi:hypothetical protein
MRYQFAALCAIVALCGLSSCSGTIEKRQENTLRQQVKAEEHPAPPKDPSEQALQTTKLEAFSWYKEGFGSIMMANFAIRNNGDLAVKDVEIECTHSAPSGTEIDSNTRTVYEIIPAHRRRQFHNFNMGFIAEQVAGSSCEIKKVFAATPEGLKRDVAVHELRKTLGGVVRDDDGTLVFHGDAFQDPASRAHFFKSLGVRRMAGLCGKGFQRLRLESDEIGETISLGCAQSTEIAK